MCVVRQTTNDPRCTLALNLLKCFDTGGNGKGIAGIIIKNYHKIGLSEIITYHLKDYLQQRGFLEVNIVFYGYAVTVMKGRIIVVEMT